MDDPVTEPNAPLDENSAASLFTQILDEPAQASAEPEVKAESTPEPETVEAESSDEQKEPTFTVRVDGEDVEIPLSELKNGYERQAASTKRFMEASDTRKAADAEIQQARAERQQTAAKLAQAEMLLTAMLQSQAQETNWDELLQSNPQEYLKQKHLAEKRQADLHRIQWERGQLIQREQADNERLQAQYLEAQGKALLDKVPEWKDAEKAKAEKVQIRDYLGKLGFDENALNNIQDHRAVLLARKAMLFDSMVERANAASKKVQTLPQKAERPGTGNAQPLDKRSAAFQRLSRTGKPEDAAAVFAGLL